MTNPTFLVYGLGGSHMYGLQNEKSDKDYRGVYVCTDIDYIIGLEAGDKGRKFVDTREDGDDFFAFELRHFLRSLRSSNTTALELLYNDKWEHCDKEWTENIAQFRSLLVDCEEFYKSLTGKDGEGGYVQNEYRLLTGERTGLLGSKRKAALDKYGYSYKNLVNVLRLCEAAINLFEEGSFLTDLTKHPSYDLILEIKNHPERFNLLDAKLFVGVAKARLAEAFKNRTFDFKFDNKVASEICYDIYKKHLESEG